MGKSHTFRPIRAPFLTHECERHERVAIHAMMFRMDALQDLFRDIVIQAGAIKSREDQLGEYPGDGPTAQQADELMQSALPFLEDADSQTHAALWEGFKTAVETEMAWLLPEKDAIAQTLIPLLQLAQKALGAGLEQMPGQREVLERYVSLSIVANAAMRQEKLNGNKIMWRLVLARLMNWIGGGKRT